MSKKNLNIEFDDLKNNDKQAFYKLYVHYYDKLCVFLLSYINDKEKIEDIVQEVFINLWSKRHKITITNSLKSYLYRSTYNKMIDSLRIQKKTNSMLLEYHYRSLMQTINLNEDNKNERLKKLDICIEELPKRCKSIFIACKISRKKQLQVATENNLSIKTVEGHISKAYKLVKQCMKNQNQLPK